MSYWENLKIGFQGIGRAYAWQINPQQALAELHYQYMLLLEERGRYERFIEFVLGEESVPAWIRLCAALDLANAKPYVNPVYVGDVG